MIYSPSLAENESEMTGRIWHVVIGSHIAGAIFLGLIMVMHADFMEPELRHMSTRFGFVWPLLLVAGAVTVLSPVLTLYFYLTRSVRHPAEFDSLVVLLCGIATPKLASVVVGHLFAG